MISYPVYSLIKYMQEINIRKTVVGC